MKYHALFTIPLFLISSFANAALCPVPSRSLMLPRDGGFTIATSELASRLTCLNDGGLNAVRNPYLLVPGSQSSFAT